MKKSTVKKPVGWSIVKWASLFLGIGSVIAGISYLAEGYPVEEFTLPNLITGTVCLAVFALACRQIRKSIDKQSTCVVQAAAQSTQSTMQSPQVNACQGYELVLSGRKSTCRITAEGIDFQNKDESFFAPYIAIENFYKFGGTLYSFIYKGKEYYMDQTSNHETISIQDAFAYAMTCWEKACATRPAVRPLRTDGEAVYVAETTFMILKVYNEWCTLTAKRNAGNLLIMDKFFNGEKKYYYSDLTNVQFREPGKVTDGYLEFEYPGSRSGKNSEAYSSENSISYGKQHAPLMKEIYTFIDGRIRECKNGQNQQAIQVSTTDELKKYKELLDMGAITQEEFDAKKKQLLGL